MNIYMTIIKYYGIIWDSIIILGCLMNTINSEDKKKRRTSLISVLINIPILIYFILS